MKFQAGTDRKELIQVCSDVSAGQVSSVGNYIEFNLQIEESRPLSTKNTFDVLLLECQVI